jgi:2-haloalkanoic acid dehalogenase type II
VSFIFHYVPISGFRVSVHQHAEKAKPMTTRYEAVIFDVLTGLIDSWTLWNTVAGDEETGQRWRHHYLHLTYGVGDYQPYEDLVVQAARECDLDEELGHQLIERWDELKTWPGTQEILRQLKTKLPLAVVTNCSERLGRMAVAKAGVEFDVVVIAERAGAYKPDPRPYQLALDGLNIAPDRALFVAGSVFDVNGAGAMGMDVFWHNRAALPCPEHAPALISESRSLEPLPGIVAGVS